MGPDRDRYCSDDGSEFRSMMPDNSLCFRSNRVRLCEMNGGIDTDKWL
ncbi:hypothetical protein HanHA89_Chr01g0002361 [Helianthus annuus]|nr:hypothetical protein HanHA89_Chr01g0002361 [Helianthus annuus]